MRVVPDTNTLTSGVISASGPPRRLLDGVRAQTFEFCSSATLLAERLDVLSRDKFAKRLTAADSSAQVVVAALRRLAYMVAPHTVPRVVAQDADDDHVLACALTGQAHPIVSGDRHLLGLGGHYQGIPIVTTAQALLRLDGIPSAPAD